MVSAEREIKLVPPEIQINFTFYRGRRDRKYICCYTLLDSRVSKLFLLPIIHRLSIVHSNTHLPSPKYQSLFRSASVSIVESPLLYNTREWEKKEFNNSLSRQNNPRGKIKMENRLELIKKNIESYERRARMNKFGSNERISLKSSHEGHLSSQWSWPIHCRFTERAKISLRPAMPIYKPS